jgi:hypothetical protein
MTPFTPKAEYLIVGTFWKIADSYTIVPSVLKRNYPVEIASSLDLNLGKYKTISF